MATQGKKSQTRSAIQDVVAREYTIHLHKRVRISRPPTIDLDRPNLKIGSKG
jgi:hypothetical protein